MPVPKPKKDEKQQEYIQRFMSDKNMLKEFPRRDQRYQVQMTTWRNKDKKSKQPSKKSSSIKESTIVRQKRLIEDKSVDPHIKLNVIEAIQLSNKKYHLLEQINNERFKLLEAKLSKEDEELQKDILFLLQKYNFGKQQFRNSRTSQLIGLFALFPGISLFGLLNMIKQANSNKKVKQELINKLMQAKGMSKEDATKIVEYALQEVSEMSPSDILKIKAEESKLNKKLLSAI